MSAFVLDVSITMTWFFEDEATPETWALLEQLGKAGAAAPPLWLYEVANVLLIAERRGRTTQARVAEFIAHLQTLPIHVEEAAADIVLRDVLALGRSAGLTAYDAAYLELALRHSLPLATKDKALIAAAQKLGVAVLP